jgi:dipeptidyl aminopeptidase/acylaminoacyl peptidase
MRLAFFCWLLLPAILVADDWTVDDLLKTESVTDVQLAADGKWAVWVKSKMDEEKGESISQLWRTNLETNRDLQLTRGQHSARQPRISPDGKYIAFLSDRPSPDPKAKSKSKIRLRNRKDSEDEPKTQVWLLDTSGGEPWPLTDFSRDVDSFQWLNSESILFLAQEEKTHHESETEEKKDTSNVVEDEAHEPPVRLFKIDVEEKKTERITNNTDRIEWFVAAPDGKRVVTSHQKSLRFTYDGRVKPTVELLTLETGKSERIFAGNYSLATVKWFPNSQGFYAINQFGRALAGEGAFLLEALTFEVKEKTIKKVPLDWDRAMTYQDLNGYSISLTPINDGFLTLLADGVAPKLARYREVEGKWKREMIESDATGNIFGIQSSLDQKTFLFVKSKASELPQWYRGRIDGSKIVDAKKFATVNKDLEEKTPLRREIVKWKGAQDEEVEGILYYPKSYEKGKKYPLVVMIHGGPHYADVDAWDDGWAYPPSLFTQKNAFVLKPNYHGSSNYGLKFAESIANGKYYELEIPDIEKGVDSLIAQGLVDADKLGVMGWSNGSILSIGLTVNTTRYKVASAGAGDVDWVSDWGNCEFGDVFDRYYFGKSPLEDPKKYQEISPFYKLDKVRTPTLIFFGTEDRAVPTQQGWMHYRGLQQLGKTDVRFVLFPGEAHGPKKYVHQKRKLTEEQLWFDKYLFNAVKPKNEAVKENSPLARLIQQNEIKKVNQRFGILLKERLIPETISHEGLQVGRFEVTQSQFAAFDPKFVVEPGKENYPAHAVSFDRAKAYCDWLSKHTGETYRLPTEDEADKLYGDSGDENTLDHWAGYTVNPDDAKRLREALKDLPGKAPLLKEVGSFSGTGEKAKPADLGGNVAEWVQGKDSKGILKGGSADTPADSKNKPGSAAEAYQGFRVVKGEAKKE